jgi:UDP-3-O-[3-hydroxymyristoyl] glucosamine N-acyltransferase
VVLTLQHLASLTEGKIVKGDPDATFCGISSLDFAKPNEISFLGNGKYQSLFHETKAGVVLVAADHPCGPENTALVLVENPTLSFSKVIDFFHTSKKSFIPSIHPTSFIDSTAQLDTSKVRIHAGVVIMAGVIIGDGTEIFPNAVIGENSRIGKDCIIHTNVSIREECILGDRCILQPGVVIGSDGYGYQFSQGKHVKIPQLGIVEIGDDVEIGANSCIDRARFGKTLIGEGTKIDNLVQIGHNVEIGRHCIIIALTGIAGSSKLGNFVTVAAQAGIAGHLSIGDKAVLASRTGVTHDLDGGVTYLGNPAQPIREELKLEALRRRLPKLFDQVKEINRSQKNPSA